MSWYWTENESRPEGKTWQHLIVILGLCFLLYHLESGGGGRVGVGGEGGGGGEGGVWNWTSSSRAWKNFGRSWTRGLDGLENWAIFMGVTCVSSLICIQLVHFFFSRQRDPMLFLLAFSFIQRVQNWSWEYNTVIFHSIITTIQISVEKTNLYDKISFLKQLAKRFEQSTSVPYQAISHTDNSKLKFTVLLWI